MIKQLDIKSGVPLYQQLSDRIRESIECGEFPVNSQIPTELMLSQKYEISRVTVRKAIDELVEDRVLVRKQGKGTFVASKNMIKSIYPFVSFKESCREAGRIDTTKVISYSLELPTRKQAAFFEMYQCSKIITIKRLRLADNIPVIFEVNCFPESFDFLAREPLESTSVVLNKYGVQTVHSDTMVNVCFATQEEAELLQVDPETPLLYAYNEVKNHDYQPVEISKLIIRSDHYQMLLRF